MRMECMHFLHAQELVGNIAFPVARTGAHPLHTLPDAMRQAPYTTLETGNRWGAGWRATLGGQAENSGQDTMGMGTGRLKSVADGNCRLQKQVAAAGYPVQPVCPALPRPAQLFPLLSCPAWPFLATHSAWRAAQAH
jgi:hypothetical protein